MCREGNGYLLDVFGSCLSRLAILHGVKDCRGASQDAFVPSNRRKGSLVRIPETP